MRIATWNVERVTPRSWRRLPVVLDALASRKHDVVVLTEAHAAITPPTGLRLSGQSTAASDRRPDERWVCIWTAGFIPASLLELFGEPERSAAVLLKPPAALPVIVFGSVLPWRGDSRRAGLSGGAAFEHSLRLQGADISRLRAEHPDSLFWLLGDLNQEIDNDGPVGTAAGRRALLRFFADQQLTALTSGSGDPLRARKWRDSIDHIIVDAASAASASVPDIWPGSFPLPGAPWPDHHGVDVSLAAL